MKNRFEVLDGWRGISILCVFAGHLFPLGLHRWEFNGAVAATGMVLFFILSGFLITNMLMRDQNILNFLIRRFMRIVPLAWLALSLALYFNNATTHQWFSNMFFYANWPPMGLMESTSHFWSLCVEVQFYLLISILVYIFKEKTFWLLPILAVCVTSYRVFESAQIAINTYFRVDEILAGCILALIYNRGADSIKVFIGKLDSITLLILLLFSAHPFSGPLNYLRPYIAMLLVGSTLFVKDDNWVTAVLKTRILFYIASISYALYVIHGILIDTWLGSGDKLIRYLKRPLLLAVTIALAHLSTKYYESYWIKLGKSLTRRNILNESKDSPNKPSALP